MPPDKPEPTVHTELERVFRNAKTPGSLVTPLTTSPEAAANVAARLFAAYLRDQAAKMWRDDNKTCAIMVGRLARNIDPLGSVMGAAAAGGTD